MEVGGAASPMTKDKNGWFVKGCCVDLFVEFDFFIEVKWSKGKAHEK